MTSAPGLHRHISAEVETGRAETPAAKRLRDRLTAEALLAAVQAMHPGVTASSFVAQWWDGTALVPALLVSVGGRPLRVVAGPSGEIVLLPRWSWAARRRLRRTRRPGGDQATGRPHVAVTPGGLPRTALLYEVSAKRPRIGRPGPRMPVRVGGAVDYRACTHVGCGAVVALPVAGPDPPCPRCGRR
ncbi:MAG: hypothetical protein ABJC62_02160 [Frankiaceae bacterium]